MAGALLRDKAVPRPSMGPLFLGAFAAWGVAVAIEQLTWGHYLGKHEVVPVPAILLAGALLVVLVVKGREHIGPALSMLAPALAIAVSVAVCSSLFWFSWETNTQQVVSAADGGGELLVDLTSDPVEKDYGTVSEAEVILDNKAVRLRMAWPQDDVGLYAGHRIAAKGAFRLPADDEGGRWNHQQGFAGMLRVISYEERGYAEGLRGLVTPLRDSSFERVRQLGGNAAGLLAGILLGNRTLYSGTQLEQDFRVTGLAHLMAVSGTHLAVVTMLALWVLDLVSLGRRARFALLAGLLVGYVALTAFAPSAMRACVMCVVCMAASEFGRRKHVPSALSACVVVFLALDPKLAFSLGFQLSVLCMAGLVLFSPLASAWIETLVPERLSKVAQGLAATFCASFATMPVAVPLFCQLPLISPVSTLLASPLVTAALALGIAGLLTDLVFKPVGAVVLGLAGTVAELCSWLVHQLACLPFACAPLDASAPWLGLLGMGMLFAMWVVWPLPQEREDTMAPKALAVLVLPVALLLVFEFGGTSAWLRAAGISVSSDAQVIMLDVGQGDAMVIRDGTSAMLVDTGEEGTVLLKALARNGVGKLDAVALSHKDVDHTGALSSLAGVVEVRHVCIHKDLVGDSVMSAVENSARRVSGKAGVEGVGVGTVLKVGRFSLTLLSPQKGGQSENEDSLIWLLSFDEDGDGIPESKGLLTGDGEQEAIEGIVSQAGDISFLKVAHHGSRDAVGAEELKVLKPELALISVGADNKYGHPTRDTLSVLKQAGCTIERTDISGDITLSFKGNHIGVKTQRKQ